MTPHPQYQVEVFAFSENRKIWRSRLVVIIVGNAIMTVVAQEILRAMHKYACNLVTAF